MKKYFYSYPFCYRPALPVLRMKHFFSLQHHAGADQPQRGGFGDLHQFQLNARAVVGFVDAPTTYSCPVQLLARQQFWTGGRHTYRIAAQMNRHAGSSQLRFRFGISDMVKLSAGFSAEYQQVRLENGIAANVFQEETRSSKISWTGGRVRRLQSGFSAL